MTSPRAGTETVLQYALTGGAAFREVAALLDGLTWDEARHVHPPLPYSLAELLYHLSVTQRASLNLASGRTATWPEDLAVWPDHPLSPDTFHATLTDLQVGLAEAQVLAADPSQRARDILTDLAVHSAYHWGQVTLIRRLTGTLPPAGTP